MTKPIEDMTSEEIAAERAAIAAEREELRQMGLPQPAVDLTPEQEVDRLNGIGTQLSEAAAPIHDLPEEEGWPHEFLEFSGMTLEVRKPGEAALVAISLTGSPSLTGDVQMKIFSKFLENHMSPKTFGEVIEAMLDPDSEISLQGLIKALAEMKR